MGNEQINVRRLVVQALVAVNRDGAYANVVLQQMIGAHCLSDVDRRFFTELFYGVVRRRNYLDAVIHYFTKRPIKKLSPLVVEILRLGVYQLLYMDRVPVSAAVNESVKLAKKMAKGMDRLVNAVLRNVDRQRDDIAIEALTQDETERWSYIYNMPLWLLKRWRKEYGDEETLGLCEYFNDTPRLTARINSLKVDIDSCLKKLADMGWVVEKTGHLPEAIYIDKHSGSLETSPVVVDGSLAFSDEASMAVAHVVNPQPGDKILDCCAAPGGKTMHMAALMKNTGEIIAGDIHEHKLNLMRQNAARLGVTIANFQLQDATQLPPHYKEQFDRVLVDAPCSGLGIMQRKLDMRWRKSEAILTALPPLQQAILTSAAATVKPGGVLVYSTCTINAGENEAVVTAFLQTHPEFTLEDAAAKLPFDAPGPMVTLLPHRDGTDGFFIARMRKALPME